MNVASKNVGQIVILAVLVLVLGISTVHMWRVFNPPSKSAKAPATATANPAAAQDKGASTTAKAGAAAKAAPPAAGTAAGKDKSKAEFAMLESGEVNGDLFRVYALQPPKNPFLQKEEWFKDELEKIPGYPELRDDNYFETMSPEFPDIAQAFGPDKKWREIMLKRENNPNVKLGGVSKDGRITTTLELKEAVPPSYDLKWTADSGIPLSALEDPDYVRSNVDKLTTLAGTAKATDGGGLMVPGAGEDATGLEIPGESSDATTKNLLTGDAKGDALACVGVNLKGGKTTALMHYNGAPYLVSAGSVLPTHYQVVEIKEDGVVLLELRDGSSKWVPLQFVAPAAK
jgi:hypothetical protein